MAIGRNLAYITFLVLLIGALIVSQAHFANAEDYWDLPQSAELTTPLKKGDRAPAFTARRKESSPAMSGEPSEPFAA